MASSANGLTPQAAIATPALVRAAGWINEEMFEPMDTMAEAALALCSSDRGRSFILRIVYSLQLLQLKRPVHDLHRDELVDGWQPEDLRAASSSPGSEPGAKQGWPDAYTFGRGHSPRPQQRALGVRSVRATPIGG